MADDVVNTQSAPTGMAGVVAAIGERLFDVLDQIGSAWFLVVEMTHWILRWAVYRRVRLGRPAIVSQIVRIGVRSIFIISLVSGCVGLILVLQMAPPLDDFGSKDLVANITGVAVFRELGPLIAAIVLTGFAGAAIAAEIGTMVVGEEIEALEAHALNPVRFLVIPRVLASVISMTCLAVLSDLVAVTSGLFTAALALGIAPQKYYSNMVDQLKFVDFATGIGKSVVFGLLIGLIACTNGLKVTGGAAGVGKATTGTVVQSVVAIVIADLIFTAIFYAWKLT
ncbi:MAG: ABC transporter permease [Phycisphaeraceae bacterium]|nr:ABC transporter permease [Phycisphaeraceae bacterium]